MVSSFVPPLLPFASHHPLFPPLIRALHASLSLTKYQCLLPCMISLFVCSLSTSHSLKKSQSNCLSISFRRSLFSFTCSSNLAATSSSVGWPSVAVRSGTSSQTTNPTSVDGSEASVALSSCLYDGGGGRV